MAESLSVYWVKFFKGAGFSQDVSTKYAVVFSNNRIQPDMLADLDKPSLREMGISLMGDMISILRYAKKVVEDTTCEKLLVGAGNHGLPSIPKKPLATTKSTVVRKVAAKLPVKSVATVKSTTAIQKPVVKSVKVVQAAAKPVAKKKVVISSTATVPQSAKVVQSKAVTVKRKIEPESEDDYDSGNEDDWSVGVQKKAKVEDEEVGYTVVLPNVNPVRSQGLLKKIVDQKRTVFDRLGDSSVTSTTNLETGTTFNVTGLGKEVFKRNSSVFNRLGDRDLKMEVTNTSAQQQKNGSSISAKPGILKSKTTTLGSIATVNRQKVIATVAPKTPKAVGTMRADFEATKKASTIRNGQRIINLTKKLSISNKPTMIKTAKVVNISSKLASERPNAVPAKARLGIGKSSLKQVTFKEAARVTRVNKPGVFSRLGV